MNLDRGMGLSCQAAEEAKIRIKITGLSNNDSQTITTGFRRTLQSYFTIDSSHMYPLTQDVPGYGFRFAVGWTLQS